MTEVVTVLNTVACRFEYSVSAIGGIQVMSRSQALGLGDATQFRIRFERAALAENSRE